MTSNEHVLKFKANRINEKYQLGVFTFAFLPGKWKVFGILEVLISELMAKKELPNLGI